VIKVNTAIVLTIIEWCLDNDIDYNLDLTSSDPLYDRYTIKFNGLKDEFLVRLQFGI